MWGRLQPARDFSPARRRHAATWGRRAEDPPQVERRPSDTESLSPFLKDVLVLSVADDQNPLTLARARDELESLNRRIDGDERNRAIVILARRNGALPLTEIENNSTRPALHSKIAERLARIQCCESSNLGPIRWN